MALSWDLKVAHALATHRGGKKKKGLMALS